MFKGKGQQVMEHYSFPLKFQLPDRKDTLETAQKLCLKESTILWKIFTFE